MIAYSRTPSNKKQIFSSSTALVSNPITADILDTYHFCVACSSSSVVGFPSRVETMQGSEQFTRMGSHYHPH